MVFSSKHVCVNTSAQCQLAVYLTGSSPSWRWPPYPPPVDCAGPLAATSCTSSLAPEVVVSAAAALPPSLHLGLHLFHRSKTPDIRACQMAPGHITQNLDCLGENWPGGTLVVPHILSLCKASAQGRGCWPTLCTSPLVCLMLSEALMVLFFRGTHLPQAVRMHHRCTRETSKTVPSCYGRHAQARTLTSAALFSTNAGPGTIWFKATCMRSHSRARGTG